MEKINVEEMEKVEGGQKDPWAEGGYCYGYLTLILATGDPSGALTKGFMTLCNS